MHHRELSGACEQHRFLLPLLFLRKMFSHHRRDTHRAGQGRDKQPMEIVRFFHISPLVPSAFPHLTLGQLQQTPRQLCLVLSAACSRVLFHRQLPQTSHGPAPIVTCLRLFPFPPFCFPQASAQATLQVIFFFHKNKPTWLLHLRSSPALLSASSVSSQLHSSLPTTCLSVPAPGQTQGSPQKTFCCLPRPLDQLCSSFWKPALHEAFSCACLCCLTHSRRELSSFSSATSPQCLVLPISVEGFNQTAALGLFRVSGEATSLLAVGDLLLTQLVCSTWPCWYCQG